jgi:hypothetical protein
MIKFHRADVFFVVVSEMVSIVVFASKRVFRSTAFGIIARILGILSGSESVKVPVMSFEIRRS